MGKHVPMVRTGDRRTSGQAHGRHAKRHWRQQDDVQQWSTDVTSRHIKLSASCLSQSLAFVRVVPMRRA